MGKQYRYFDRNFKKQAVLLSYQRSNIAELERELNITPALLYKWRQDYEKFAADCFHGKGKPKVNRKKTIISAQSKADTDTKKRFFDTAFKENAVHMSFQRSNISQLEKELNITAGCLHSWRRIFEKFGAGCFCGKGRTRIDPEQQKIYVLERKCYEAELRLEILKKSLPYLKKDFPAIFEFIKENEQKYTIYKMCRALEISESSYRLWKKQPLSDTKKRIVLLKEKITSLFIGSSNRYGCVKIAKELTNSGTKISYTQVGLYMKQMGLHPKAKRKFKITTDSKHNFYTSPNVLNQQFKVSGPSKVWVSDITYIQTNKRFLYLTIVMDLYDRKIIGWSLSSTMTAQRTSIAAWEMAVGNRSVEKGLIFHSDRGVQYACRSFITRLDSYNCIIRSMSRKENFLDNAHAESFFNTLKRELIYRNKLLSKKEIKTAVIDYIKNWYNKIRIHSSLNYKTIEEFNTGK
ncbi:IS3 family transposase [Flavobacterium sp. YO12]|uniref:IS3 family transposase n=1 Tax=Flavobacterium sp. YO12 TaxID=1920029 RepID=UPI00100B5EE0|nr:IS3 family transposase [Flavobacterium sp. YO12]